MQPPLRIAILEADTPLDGTKKRYGGYGGVFTELLQAGAKPINESGSEVELKIRSHQIVDDPENYPDLDDIDAILITGSRHDSFADTPWINKLVEFTTKVLAQDRVRLIGVCFGHQIIGRAMGVKVGRNDGGWEAAVNDIELSNKGKEIFGQDTLSLHQMHRDIIFYYPPDVEELGYSPVCKVQGMYARNRLITVQGHPEFNEEIMREILETRHQTGIFNEEAFNMYIKKVALPHDGVVVSQAFIRFLLEG